MSTASTPEPPQNPGKVLVLGNGGRENALGWKLFRAPSVDEVYVYPGNAVEFRPVEEPLDDTDSIVSFCLDKGINLVVIGPEDLLYQGYAERISPFIKCFGPTKEAARLEWSKSYAKAFMRKAKIPTADFEVFTDLESATNYINKSEWKSGFVVKASGLAGGKGVVVVDTPGEAIMAAKEMLVDDKFGEAGHEIVVEERLHGNEVSAFCLTDGKTIRMLPLIQDYKRLLDDDKGPNTGGMGVIGPVLHSHTTMPASAYKSEQKNEKKIVAELEEICQLTVSALKSENIEYKGVLYVGAIITKNGLKVLEYNCRFGDPETQALVRLLDTDLYRLFLSCIDGTLEWMQIDCHPKCCVCGIVLASEGYPEKPHKGAVITGVPDASSDYTVVVFHAGTMQKGNNMVVRGGRVLCVTSTAPSMEQARTRAYHAITKIHFEGMFFRKDIGAGSMIKYY